MIKTSQLLALITFGLIYFYAISTKATVNSITVAVIDTGIDPNHIKLKNHLWMNSGEIGIDKQGRNKSNNGIDDDENGYIDDVNGWNFTTENSLIVDSHGHGTHIAGIIAEGNYAKIMVLKAFDEHISGAKAVQASIQAIHYAIKMKAQVINYSGGGVWPSQEEREALKLAEKNGILVVAAAGNERSNADEKKYYPAGYGLSNILSVAAVDLTGKLLPSSNWGKNTVSVAALGQQVLSSLPQNQFGSMTGTSQATAQVTRTAVLLLEKNKIKTSPSKLIQVIAQTGDPVKDLKGKIKNPVVVNTLRALQANLVN